METWRDIEFYENMYQVSDLGNVRSLDREIIKRNKNGELSIFDLKGKLLKCNHDSNGYKYVSLGRGIENRFYVHELVVNTFIGEYEGMEINHKDLDKSNNKLSNLEIVTIENSCK